MDNKVVRAWDIVPGMVVKRSVGSKTIVNVLRVKRYELTQTIVVYVRDGINGKNYSWCDDSDRIYALIPQDV